MRRVCPPLAFGRLAFGGRAARPGSRRLWTCPRGLRATRTRTRRWRAVPRTSHAPSPSSALIHTDQHQADRERRSGSRLKNIGTRARKVAACSSEIRSDRGTFSAQTIVRQPPGFRRAQHSLKRTVRAVTRRPLRVVKGEGFANVAPDLRSRPRSRPPVAAGSEFDRRLRKYLTALFSDGSDGDSSGRRLAGKKKQAKRAAAGAAAEVNASTLIRDLFISEYDGPGAQRSGCILSDDPGIASNRRFL